MDRQFVVPYIISFAIAFGYAVLVWKRPTPARYLIGITFISASLFNFWWALHSPGIYVQGYGPHAIGIYRDFIYGVFSRHTTAFVIAIASGQFLGGVLMFASSGWRRLGYLAIVVFLLAIAPLGVGSAFPSTLIFAAAVGCLAYRERDRLASSAASS